MQKILKFVILILIVFFSSNIESLAKDIKFIQITDLHYNDTRASSENYNKLINQINNTKNLDFVAFTGDNIDVADKKTLENFLRDSQKIKVPFYLEVGDHDVFKSRGLSKVVYKNFLNSYHHAIKIKNFNFVVKKSNIVFIFLDGTKEVVPSQNGYFRNDTLAWFDLQLNKYKNKNIIVLQHYPVIEMRPNSSHNLVYPERYIAILDKHKNVKAIFAGHYHSPQEVEINGVYHIISGAASGDNPSYRQILIQDNGRNNIEIFSQTIPIK